MKNKSKFIILALIMLISVIGVSYAFFEYYRVGDNSSKLIFGDIYLKMNEGKDTITLLNVFPETAEKARERTDNQITFTVSGINTTTNKDIWYEIMLNEGNEVEGRTRFNPEDLVFDLIEVNEDKTETYLVDAQSFGDINAKRIWVETVNRNTTKEVNKTYKLRMWLSEDVFISDTNPNATYDVETFESSYASVKVSVYGDFVEKNVVTGYIIYDMSSLGIGNLQSTPIYNKVSGVVTIEVPDISGYEFLGWSTTLSGDVVYLPGDTINASDIADNNMILYPIMKKALLSDKIVNNIDLRTDSYNTKFVYGSDVENNYVWYSGKLWRIVGINSNGSIKLITQNNITAMAWSTSTTNTNYTLSQVRTWLNNEFLQTLSNADELIVTSNWDYATYSNFPTAKKTSKTVSQKVGLLNIYECMMTNTTTGDRYAYDSFLANGYDWWTLSPKKDNSYVWYIGPYGFAYTSAPAAENDYLYGVRPSINMKADIAINGNGDGTKENPYLIVGDLALGKENELLNDRISGEYIKFNNVLYRIVDSEEINERIITKVTMADYSLNENIIFNNYQLGFSYNNSVIFRPDGGVGGKLNEWYLADSTSSEYTDIYIEDFYKNMIATAEEDGVVWYQGPESGVGYDYTLSKTGNPISSTMGVPYYGEMFSTNFGGGRDSSNAFWLMTIFSSSSLWSVSGTGSSYPYSSDIDNYVRPSFYLKSNVVIGDVDGDGHVGTGMPHDPYEIKQLS